MKDTAFYGPKGQLLEFNKGIYVISGRCDYVRETHHNKRIMSIRFPEATTTISVGKFFKGGFVQKIVPVTDAYADELKGVHNYVIITNNTKR